MPLAAAAGTFRHLILSASPQRVSRTNFLANILLFVPAGFALMGAQLAGRRARLAAAASIHVTLVASVSVSAGVEFLQLFAPGRVSSRADIAAQTIGCAVGIVGWLALGRNRTEWTQQTAARSQTDRLARLLAAYAFVWLFVGLASFDVTVDVGELGQRLRGGMITI